MTEEIQKVDRRTREYRQQKAAQAAPPVPPADVRMDIDGGEPAPAASPTRTQTRVSARTTPDGRLEVTGRNGEVLSRTRTYVGDIFEIPKELMEPGWSLQWNAVSIAGNSDIILDQNHMMHQNGWRPVPAERFAGKLVPKGSTGPIIRGQQMLMERPQSMTDEANREDQKNARELISARNESLKLTKVRDQLPDGMEMAGKYIGTGGGMRLSIDKSLDVLAVNREAGNYKLDE
jgi:hypothetical protein